MDLNVGIIGYGKLGSAFAKELHKLQMLKWIVARNYSNCNDFNGVEIFDSIAEINFIPDIILLAVQDSKIPTVVEELLNLDLSFENKIFAHCSGFLRAIILQKLKQKNAIISSIHPFQTFYYSETTNFHGLWYGVEAENSAISTINKFIKEINGNAYYFDDENIKNKEFYHLSAVAVSNFLTPIIQLGKQFADISGINPKDFFLPIINQTLQNNFKSFDNDSFPLTGTISRGDTYGLSIHLNKLTEFPELKIIFKQLSLATVHSAFFNKAIDEKKYQEFLQLLEN